MHLDALADTADALGGSSRERALEIMRDHAVGAFGAVALVVVCLVDAAAIGALAEGGDAARLATVAAQTRSLADTLSNPGQRLRWQVVTRVFDAYAARIAGETDEAIRLVGEAADLYEDAIAILGEAGWDHYEIANWARTPDRYSRHNAIYWQHGDYLGIGAGAATGVRSAPNW